MLIDFNNSARFLVYLGSTKFSFSKISGIRKNMEFTPILEGGLNDDVHMMPAPIQQRNKVIFERGWYPLPLDKSYMRPGMRIDAGITIIIPDEKRSPGGGFFLYSPIVESWELSDMDAMNSAVIIKKFSVLCSRIEDI